MRGGRDTRRGRENVWEMEAQRLEDAKRYLDQIGRQWDAAAEWLMAFVVEG